MEKKILVNVQKYNEAYHDLQKCMYKIKELLDSMVKTSAEMLDCIEEVDDIKKGG